MYERIVRADFELKSGEVMRVEELRVEFQILKTRKSEANKAEIRITNLSQNTRNRIREKDALVRLYAGYRDEQGAALIFVGNSQLITTRFETPDIVTHIEAKDGQRTLRETRLSLSYGDRTSAQTILTRLAGDLGTPLRQDFQIPGSYQGYSFSGRAKDAIDEITRRAGFDWSIVDGEMQVLPKNGNTGRVAVRLTPQTGLVNYPERLFDQEGEFEDALEKELEWKVTSLLNPRLFPGALVELDSQQAKGLFQVETVRHYGDTRGRDFYSEIEIKAA